MVGPVGARRICLVCAGLAILAASVLDLTGASGSDQRLGPLLGALLPRWASAGTSAAFRTNATSPCGESAMSRQTVQNRRSRLACCLQAGSSAGRGSTRRSSDVSGSGGQVLVRGRRSDQRQRSVRGVHLGVRWIRLQSWGRYGPGREDAFGTDGYRVCVDR